MSVIKKMKPLKAIKNSVGGYDLLTERDAGNEILCLTGNEKRSLDYWMRMQDLAERVVIEIKGALPADRDPEIFPLP